jgi:hypothetical protein
VSKRRDYPTWVIERRACSAGDSVTNPEVHYPIFWIRRHTRPNHHRREKTIVHLSVAFIEEFLKLFRDREDLIDYT